MLKFTNIDKEVYNYIHENKVVEFDTLINNLNLDVDSIRRSLEFLKSENIISENVNSKNSYLLSDVGKKALTDGTIESKFCDFLENNSLKMGDLKNTTINGLSSQEVPLAFGVAKRNGLIIINSGTIVLSENYKSIIQETVDCLKKINAQEDCDNKLIEKLFKRKFVIKKLVSKKKYNFIKEVEYTVDSDSVINLTSDLIKTKEYKKIKLKDFDVEKLSKPMVVGRIHPLRQVMNYIRDLYLEMGFKEMASPYVDLSFWAMDSMFISQEHPMRDIQDTFYLPYHGVLPSKQLLDKIAELHENGGDTGSIGYKYAWDQKKASELILRTHTTAATFRKLYHLSDEEKKECKYFAIGRVFRNETVDSTHLPEFHQAEGFVIGDDLSLADLVGFIKVFLGKLGFNKIKIKPTYNPYTEPSVEVFIFHNKLNKWIEIMNSGIFRKESVAPYGIKNNIIAWGIGIERIVMLMYNKTSLKEISGEECDIDWLRTYPIPNRKFE